MTVIKIARADNSVLDVPTHMRHKGVRRIPVTGPNGQLIGLLAADPHTSEPPSPARPILHSACPARATATATPAVVDFDQARWALGA